MGERTEGVAVALEAEQGGVVVVALREFGGFGLVRGTCRGGAFAILRTLRIVGTRPSALQARLGEQQRKRLTERCASRALVAAAKFAPDRQGHEIASLIDQPWITVRAAERRGGKGYAAGTAHDGARRSVRGTTKQGRDMRGSGRREPD